MFNKLRDLFKNLTIYGLGDVITQIISFLLLPLYVRYLTPTDYGVIGLLLSVEVVAKIVFRWGVDASFMRLYHDRPTREGRQLLASTIFFFLLATNGILLLAGFALAPTLGQHLLGTADYTLALRVLLINTFIGAFYFIPFHVIRIRGEATQFVRLTMTRSAATIAVRIVLVVGAGLGVLGFFLADIVVTSVFTFWLAKWFAPLLRPMFSRRLLREALAFGLPRLPHGFAHQMIAVADRYVLTLFLPLSQVGVYSIGASFGMSLKLFLGAFEYAWAPFYFATMKEPDAKHVFAVVTTYGVAILVFLAAGLSAIAPELVQLMTAPQFYGAAAVIPWIAIGVSLQGFYLLTSIGLNITKHTRYYPVATAVAAVVSVASNFFLIPRFGMIGAAWSNAIAYGVLAVLAMYFSQRFYPLPLEWRRLAHLIIIGGACYLAAIVIVPASAPMLVRLLVRGSIVAIGYPAVLYLTHFLEHRELVRLRSLADAMRGRPGDRSEPPVASAGDMSLSP